MRGFRKDAGFSLLELLVAIALVLVLGLVATGVVQRVKEKSLEASCMGRLRQIGVATLLHANDNRQRILLYNLVPATPSSGAKETLWMDTVSPYGITAEATFCPALLAPQRNRYIAYGRRAVDDISAALKDNQYTGSTQGGSVWLYLQRLEAPGSFVMMADSLLSQDNSSAIRAGQQFYNFRLDGTRHGAGVHIRHHGRACVLFADGSVKALPPQGLKEVGVVSGFNAAKKPELW